MASEPKLIASRPPSGPYQDDVQLADYLLVGWRYRWLILLVTVAGGLLGLVASRVLPPSYEAAAVVSFVPRPATGPAPMTVADLQPLFRNQTLVAKVLGDLGLGGRAAVEFVADRVVLEPVPGTNMVRVRVILDSPDRAAKVANELARQAIESTVRTIRSESAAARDALRADLEKAKTHLDDTVAGLGRIQAANGLGVESAESGRGPLAIDRANLRDVAADIGSQKAKLVALEQELKRQRPADSMIQRLEYRLASERSQLAALIERQRLLTERMRNDSTERQLTARYAQEDQLAAVRASHDAARTNYIATLERYRAAELDAENPTPPMRVVDQAQPPLSAVSRGPLGSTLIGLVLGMFVAVIVALTLNYFKMLSARVHEI